MKYYFPIHLNGGNRGCEAIAKGSAELLNLPKENLIGLCSNVALDIRLGVDKYITLTAAYRLTFVQRIIRKIISLFNIQKANDYGYAFMYNNFLDQIQSNDIMLSTGGDMMCYTDNEVIYTNDYLHKKGVKTVLWGCSIGKDNLTLSKIDTLNRFSCIYARESLTYEMLKSLNLNNVVLFPDPAFILSPEKCKLPEIFKTGKVVGINLSNYVVGDDHLNTSFGAEVHKLIDYIFNETNLNILLIPHVLWNSQDDRLISQEVVKQYNHNNRISTLESELLNYEQIRYVISQCHLFIGARTHAIISAYATCTPAIALGYSVKARGIAKDLQLNEQLVVNSKDFKNNQLLESFCYALSHESEIRLHLETIIPSYLKRMETLKETIIEVLKR